jgi:ribonuclease HI
VAPAVAAKYPGWVPPECGDCYGGGTARTASRGSGGSSREEHLTLADVLLTYEDGPDTGVFTDGSSIPNPGPGGWGAVWVQDGEVRAQDHGHDPDTTNNRMELTAIIRGIELVPVGEPVTVYTDSKLAVDTLTTWAAGWERRGWKRKTGPIKNLDLVKEAWALVQARPEVELQWIKAHAGSRWNE